MLINLLDKQLQDEGYISCRTDIPAVRYLFKLENGYYNVIRIIDCKKESPISHEIYEHQREELVRAMSRSENNGVHVMTLVVFDDMKTAFDMAGEDYMCWLVDAVSMQMTLNNNRIEDFYGLKQWLEAFLSKCRTYFENGDIQSIDRLSRNAEETKRREKIRLKKPVPVTLTIVSVSIIIFITYLIIGDAFIESGNMDPVKIQAGEFYRLLTPIFLHSGWDHLFSNLMLLYFLGEAIEPKIGSVRFAAAFFISGILGNVVSYRYSLISEGYTSVGASGAVFGIIGVFTVLAIKKYKGVDVPMRRLLLMLAYCIYSSFDAYVDFAAHIGGLLTGIILAVVFCFVGGKKHEG